LFHQIFGGWRRAELRRRRSTNYQARGVDRSAGRTAFVARRVARMTPILANPAPRLGDYHCAHSVVIEAHCWDDDVRLSDLEPKFTCLT